MDSDMAFLKNLEAFLDSSLINVASTESPFDTDDASLLLGTAESVNLSSALETDPITARTLPGLIASITKPAVAPVIKSVRIQKMPFEQRRPSADKLKKTTKKTTAHPELNMRPSKIWKNVAVAELEARERAEEEFQRLVAAVTAQAKLIDDLTRIMRKQIASVPVIRKTTRSQPPDSSLCAAFLQDLEVNYTQIDKVFEDTNFVSNSQVLAEGEGFLRGIRADETGWCRVRPPTNPAEPGAWIELYARRTILHYTEGQLDAHTVGLFNDVLQCNLGEEQDEERAEGL
ncbi:hypothetical protein GQ600_12913 [Phytophthora cactorum]|nr:hypothetical protein GQ600_12913 [Phytophthora cactorum]